VEDHSVSLMSGKPCDDESTDLEERLSYVSINES